MMPRRAVAVAGLALASRARAQDATTCAGAASVFEAFVADCPEEASYDASSAVRSAACEASARALLGAAGDVVASWAGDCPSTAGYEAYAGYAEDYDRRVARARSRSPERARFFF